MQIEDREHEIRHLIRQLQMTLLAQMHELADNTRRLHDKEKVGWEVLYGVSMFLAGIGFGIAAAVIYELS